ncbi:MAG: V-type ATP synthase subunit F [Clostridiaceae bacterium]|nr:V-type ATP synthase subunit F [Clostridiaceae bacterium]
MYKIAAMGDRDSISGFASVGLELFTLDQMPDPSETLHNLASNQYAIILITEALAISLKDDIDRYKDRQLPVIVPIPGVSGDFNIGMKAISDAVERAVGSDILKDT